MRIPRKVIGRKGQLLVALPAGVRDHLGLVASATVYWHTTSKGAATLTATGRARGGRPRLDRDCPSCAKYRDQVEQLRKQLRGAGQQDYNTAFGQGYHQGVKSVPIWRQEVQWVRNAVYDLRDTVLDLIKRGATAAPPKPVPSPSSPPSPAQPITCPACGALMLDDERCPSCGFSGGDAASGAERPQAAHE